MHARLSPSASARWLQCPGSVKLIEQTPGMQIHVDNVWTNEGTMAHNLAEIEASHYFELDSPAKHRVRLAHWRDTTPDGYHADMLLYAGQYVELLARFVEEHEHSQVLLEQRVNPGVTGCWGTADAVIVSPDSVHVVDYKYGMGVEVEAEGNSQLLLYALGALEGFGEVLGEASQVCTTIHQPRREHISHACLSASDLRQWRTKFVEPMAELALSDQAYLSPSEEACRFCPAAGECRARAEYMTKRDFGNPDLLSPDEVAQQLADLPDIEAWCRAMRETALRRAYYDQVEFPGWKLVRAEGKRAIKDHTAAIEKLTEAGFEFEQVSRVSTQTLGNLEKLVGGKPILAKLLGELIVKPEGKESLVPETDPRPAVDLHSQAAQDFKDE